MNGGYVMIDCTGLDLTLGETPQTLTGIYARVQEAMRTGKALLACNANWNGAPVTPIYVFAIQFDGVVICTASTLQVNVAANDTITISNMVA